MVGFEVQKQGKYVNILPDRVNNSDLEVLTRDEKHVFYNSIFRIVNYRCKDLRYIYPQIYLIIR